MFVRTICRLESSRHVGVARWGSGSFTHFQPAAEMRRAYILPMSPIPMMPTIASPIFAGAMRLQHEGSDVVQDC